MQSKTSTYLLAGVLAVVLLAGAFAGGIFVGWALPSAQAIAAGPAVISAPTPLPGTTAVAQPTVNPANTQELFRPFWQAWDLVHRDYVDKPLNDLTLMRGAIRGMMQALDDPHSSYMDPQTYESATAELTGKEYEGIGAWVDITGEYLRIISPIPNTPALKAGLKAGDTVLAVDKEDMTGIPGDIVLKKILGPAGSNVTLTILRKNETKPFDITIMRAKIVVPMAEWRMEKNNVAYIRLLTFGNQTLDELKKALRELLAKKPSGLILDLRNNGGGYLETAVDVVSQFIPAGQVVLVEEYGDGRKVTYKARSGGLAVEIPMVVLVNEGSASASEITAGALQDYGRAQLVGTKTYGKGSVQQWNQLAGEQGAVRITIARWLTPKERQINKVGLNPDVETKITDEDIKADLDPQLDKAIELLTRK